MEYVALGVVSHLQPCTSYRVMQAFKDSSSTYFSGSAGSIYPLLERLVSKGMLLSKTELEGRKKVTRFRISSRGKKVLRAWLLDPFLEEDVFYSVDLVKTRIYFLDHLEPNDQRTFFEQAVKNVERAIEVRRKRLEEGDFYNDFFRIAVLGAIHGEEARLEFLKEALKLL